MLIRKTGWRNNSLPLTFNIAFQPRLDTCSKIIHWHCHKILSFRKLGWFDPNYVYFGDFWQPATNIIIYIVKDIKSNSKLILAYLGSRKQNASIGSIDSKTCLESHLFVYVSNNNFLFHFPDKFLQEPNNLESSVKGIKHIWKVHM